MAAVIYHPSYKMGAFRDLFTKLKKPSLYNGFIIFVLLLVPVADGLNLGLIAGDLKRHSSPIVIKKISKLSPVFININSRPKIKRALSTPKLPKLPPLKIIEPIKPSKKIPRSILSAPLLPPLVPKLPFIPILPILPPLLPPILPSLLPKLPLLPILPPLPLVPSLKSPLKPLRVPILGKQKTLGTELKAIKIPILKEDKKKDMLKKLLDLKIKGSLTTPEYIKLRKLLVK